MKKKNLMRSLALCLCALLRAPEPAAAPALHGRHLPLEAGQNLLCKETALLSPWQKQRNFPSW